ncbi:MAG TPA: DUF1573 domain-containing protein [Thermoanaerobaculia bacterium]|nr:DUF1573 domain-containing protein [Thermoanaerobaculia bacterium]
MMSKQFKVVLTALLALTFAAMAFAQENTGPQLTMVDPMKDFGTVAKGAKLEWDFTIRNTGTSNLEIINVQPACGCTVAKFDKVIAPGATGKIHAVIDTAQFSGPIAKGITIQTNDVSTPNAQLTMRAIVRPYVEAYPAGFLRYMLLQGEQKTQSAVIYSEEEGLNFEIVGVDSPADYIKVDYAKIENAEDRAEVGLASQNQWRVNVTVGGADAKIGPLADKVRIRTNSPNQPEYLLSIAGLIRPSSMVTPSVLNFGDVAPSDAEATRTVVLRSNDPATQGTFKVTKVESSTPAVVAESRSSAPGSYEVVVRLAQPAKAGTFNGNLVIHTNDPLNPVYTVPVQGNIKS